MASSVTRKTYAEWSAEGVELFGNAKIKWVFVCPSCGRQQTQIDYQVAGAPNSAVGYSCIGRWMHGEKALPAFSDKAIQRGEGCDYAGGGLLTYNPILLTDRDGRRVFDFFRRTAK